VTRGRATPGILAGSAVAVVLVTGACSHDSVPLAATAKPVSVVTAAAALYRASRVYVGTLQPWVLANVAPQLVSAYVDTVLVRPGAAVARGDILATLDCRNPSATSQAMSMQAHAIDARQRAVADEATRMHSLLDGGFISINEVEQKNAQSASQAASLLSQKAKVATAALEVSDCVLRAPFDGEIGMRALDPGAFVRPGTPIVSVIDRTTVRIVGDAPEGDFAFVAPGTRVKIHALATGQDLDGTVARRSPAADPAMRTIEFEIDLPDPSRLLPVGTTAEIHIDVGEPRAVTQVPLSTVQIRGEKAVLFVVEGEVAHSRTVPVLGESGDRLFLAPELKPGSLVVAEGRGLLEDGDLVTTKPAAGASR
jgi:membrane fusion protein (multidrug efflux system)